MTPKEFSTLRAEFLSGNSTGAERLEIIKQLNHHLREQDNAAKREAASVIDHASAHLTVTTAPDYEMTCKELTALRLDAERYRYLRNRYGEAVLSGHGPSAGCWIDCEDEEGTLTLLTDREADDAIDMARRLLGPT